MNKICEFQNMVILTNKYLNSVCLKDEKAEERYKHALNIEKSKRASDLARKAERLKLLYKTRFEEDLRAFLIVHKDQGSNYVKCNSQKQKKESKSIVKDVLNRDHFIKERDRTSKIDHSFIPTWAWPASLRNKKDTKLISLFYTAETNVPLSPTQIGGNFGKKDLKSNQMPGTDKIRNIYVSKMFESQRRNNKTRTQKPEPTFSSENNRIKNQRQKLYTKYGPPFAWIRNKSTENTFNEDLPSVKSESSTSQSQIFTEIPKQPSIYPLELRNENVNLSKNQVHDFIKKTQKMQKTLEMILGNSFESNGRVDVLLSPLNLKELKMPD